MAAVMAARRSSRSAGGRLSSPPVLLAPPSCGDGGATKPSAPEWGVAGCEEREGQMREEEGAVVMVARQRSWPADARHQVAAREEEEVVVLGLTSCGELFHGSINRICPSTIAHENGGATEQITCLRNLGMAHTVLRLENAQNFRSILNAYHQ